MAERTNSIVKKVASIAPKFVSNITFIIAVCGILAVQAVTNFKATDTTAKFEDHCKVEMAYKDKLSETLSDIKSTLSAQTKQLEYLTEEVKMLRQERRR